MVSIGELSDQKLANKLNSEYPTIVKRVRGISDIPRYALAKRLKLFIPNWDFKNLSSAFRDAIIQFISSFPEFYFTEKFEEHRNVITRRIFGRPSSKKVGEGKGVGKDVRRIEEEEIRGEFFDQRMDIYKSLYDKISPLKNEFELPFVDIIKKLQKSKIEKYIMPQITHPEEVISEVRGYVRGYLYFHFTSKNIDYEFYEPTILTPDLAVEVDGKQIAVEIKEFGPPIKTYNQILKYLNNYDEVILACPNIPNILSKGEITKQEFADYFNQKREDLERAVTGKSNKLYETYSKLWNYSRSDQLNLEVAEECVLIACMEVSYGNVPKLRYKLKEVKSTIENIDQMDFSSIITSRIGKGGKYNFLKIRLE
jgi:predicted nuclease with TOPRIM domain